MAAKILSVAVAVAIGLSAEPSRAQVAETEFRAMLDAIERERAEGEREKPQLSPPTGSPSLLDTKSIQATLRPDDIAVVFFLAEPQSFRWVISSEHIVFDRIAGRAAIEKDVTHLRELLRGPTAHADLKGASERLGDVLFEDISTADGFPMVIVPHGVLHDVPFEVLTLQNRLVVERHAVSYATSLNALVRWRRAPASPTRFRVLAAGNSEEQLHAIGFIQRLHRELNLGQQADEALRRAKIAYLNHPRYSHPFYWSSLVLLGDGTRTLVGQPVAGPLDLTILAAALALSALGVAFRRLPSARMQKRKEARKSGH